MVYGDEVVTAFEHEVFANFLKGIIRLQTGDFLLNTLFSGIKQCYRLINNVDKTPGLEKDLIDDYKAQADFLIAYYHFLLLKNYGPIILVKEEPSLDTPR